MSNNRSGRAEATDRSWEMSWFGGVAAIRVLASPLGPYSYCWIPKRYDPVRREDPDGGPYWHFELRLN